jgi:hypothetical protein
MTNPECHCQDLEFLVLLFPPLLPPSPPAFFLCTLDPSTYRTLQPATRPRLSGARISTPLLLPLVLDG